jgi:hypothetical protein
MMKHKTMLLEVEPSITTQFEEVTWYILESTSSLSTGWQLLVPQRDGIVTTGGFSRAGINHGE